MMGFRVRGGRAGGGLTPKQLLPLIGISGAVLAGILLLAWSTGGLELKSCLRKHKGNPNIQEICNISDNQFHWLKEEGKL